VGSRRAECLVFEKSWSGLGGAFGGWRAKKGTDRIATAIEVTETQQHSAVSCALLHLLSCRPKQAPGYEGEIEVTACASQRRCQYRVRAERQLLERIMPLASPSDLASYDCIRG